MNNPSQLSVFESYKTADQKFLESHIKNPEVYREFKRLAFTLISKGHLNYGAKGIMEVVRWHRTLDQKGREFKISNNFTSRYARLFMREFPQHKDFFRTKELKS